MNTSVFEKNLHVFQTSKTNIVYISPTDSMISHFKHKIFIYFDEIVLISF
jgi:hypothetical protein